MNQSEEIGLTDSNFVNTSGCRPVHLVTAKDLSIPGPVQFPRPFPEYYPYFSEGIHLPQDPARQPQPLLYRGAPGRRPEDRPPTGGELQPPPRRSATVSASSWSYGLNGIQERADEAAICWIGLPHLWQRLHRRQSRPPAIMGEGPGLARSGGRPRARP